MLTYKYLIILNINAINVINVTFNSILDTFANIQVFFVSVGFVFVTRRLRNSSKSKIAKSSRSNHNAVVFSA